MQIGPYSHEEYMEEARKFHGYAAPGIMLGGYMVELARQGMPKDVRYDALCETDYCLPDAIQLLTPCTYGNGWLKVINLGLFALSLYDKQNGKGVRISVDLDKLGAYPTIREWLLKLKPKREQNSDLLHEEIYEAKASIFRVTEVEVKPQYAVRRSKGAVALCAICGEPHPAKFGLVCRSCQGESPYQKGHGLHFAQRPNLQAVSVDEAVGQSALHDMTCIQSQSKGAAFSSGQVFTDVDKETLRKMGRNLVYVGEQDASGAWVHENEVAQMLAQKLPDAGVRPDERIKEGKINFFAGQDGVFWLNRHGLDKLNKVPDVICAALHCGTVVKKDDLLAGARAIPLYLGKNEYLLACNAVDPAPLFTVLPMRKARVGILLTGTEVFSGLIEDRFEPVIRSKVAEFDCTVVAVGKAPDDLDAIHAAILNLQDQGADLLVVTGGMSVDPEDYTRHALARAGLTDFVYGIPLLPGAMTLAGKIANEHGQVDVLGVPAGALFSKAAAFDFLLPLVLANAPIDRAFMDGLGHGGLCMGCKICTYPKCAYAK